jgi:hypothetical protein
MHKFASVQLQALRLRATNQQRLHILISIGIPANLGFTYMAS